MAWNSRGRAFDHALNCTRRNVGQLFQLLAHDVAGNARVFGGFNEVSRHDGIDEVVTIVANRHGESHFLAGYLMRMALATNLNRWPRKEALD